MSTKMRLIGIGFWLVILAAALIAMASLARAQQAVNPVPLNTTGTNVSATVAVTDTYQQVFAASTATRGRTGCTIINYGTHTMWVYEDNFNAPVGLTAVNAAVTTYKAKSVQLSQGQAYYCGYNGTVLRGAVFITGTGTDAFYAVQQ